MTDKLTCPFCGEPLEKDDYCYIAACMNCDCDGGYWIGIDTWRQIIGWKQTATVLQKKLDKVTAIIKRAINNISNPNNKLPTIIDKTIADKEVRHVICTVLGNVIKEIEDIKE